MARNTMTKRVKRYEKQKAEIQRTNELTGQDKPLPENPRTTYRLKKKQKSRNAGAARQNPLSAPRSSRQRRPAHDAPAWSITTSLSDLASKTYTNVMQMCGYPAQQESAQQPSSKDVPIQKPSVEKQPMRDPPIQKPPTQTAVVGKQAVEQPARHEPSVQKLQAQDQSAQDQSSQESPTRQLEAEFGSAYDSPVQQLQTSPSRVPLQDLSPNKALDLSFPYRFPFKPFTVEAMKASRRRRSRSPEADHQRSRLPESNRHRSRSPPGHRHRSRSSQVSRGRSQVPQLGQQPSPLPPRQKQNSDTITKTSRLFELNARHPPKAQTTSGSRRSNALQEQGGSMVLGKGEHAAKKLGNGQGTNEGSRRLADYHGLSADELFKMGRLYQELSPTLEQLKSSADSIRRLRMAVREGEREVGKARMREWAAGLVKGVLKNVYE